MKEKKVKDLHDPKNPFIKEEKIVKKAMANLYL